jgi:hypothetical protein
VTKPDQRSLAIGHWVSDFWTFPFGRFTIERSLAVFVVQRLLLQGPLIGTVIVR